MSASKLVASSEYEAAAKLFQGLTTLFSVFTVAALSAAILPAGCYIWLYRRLLQVNVASIEEETEVTVEDGSELLFEHGEEDEKTEEEDGRLRGTLWMDNFVFNKLCHNIHYASDRNYLHKLFVDVNEYHNSRRNIWRSKLMRDYFGNPWATISLIAAVAHCQFTVVQYRCCEPNHKQGQAGAS
ncbi:hypothetical protein J5N97_010699 [Dioscorea zingiberensis]|uniref:Uncharacterized protein n=1 Tax=Dioscorea zingiberensis TaxID=325984 RepID=A0A9D5HMT3_9LILI|nr:hypothetical protein J5N97_010699 [Dioscorea zingiberensis]